MAIAQTHLLLMDDSLQSVLLNLAESSIEERGAIFTRCEVVDFILDLVGYEPGHPLHTCRALEPSFGQGDFLLPMVERLLTSYAATGPAGDNVADLRECIRAAELHRDTYATTRERLGARLREFGFNGEQSTLLLDAWLVHGDFLLTELPGQFDFVLGNPPYVRQELVPEVLLSEYRKRFRTIYDRADLYVPFLEKSLLHLRSGGSLGFICSDRWMKNRYGGPLRKLIADRYHVKYYVDMVDTPAFHSNVIAYSAITVITAEPSGPTRVARRPRIESESLATLAAAMRHPDRAASEQVVEVPKVARGSEPWMLGAPDGVAVVRRLETALPTIEEAGCKVGIGVATGADRVFIAPYEAMAVEPDRKLPLVMTRDIQSGTIVWRGFGVLNPFQNDGTLVKLENYPLMANYLNGHEEAVRRRHVAQQRPESWYRTIDRIFPPLAHRPKLLIPDIKGKAHVVLDDGRFYPHHNLYYVTSDEWDLKALQAVLRSQVGTLFVSAYSTRMAGGFLRFQAQYLRRIRLPRWSDVPSDLRTELQSVASNADADDARCNAVVFELYQLTSQEQLAILSTKE